MPYSSFLSSHPLFLGRTVCWFFALFCTSLHAGDWTRFRGPNGSGISDAASIPAQWTEKDYNWKVKLPGEGHSSPVVAGEKVFLTAGDPKTGTHFVFRIRATDGRRVWIRDYPGDHHSMHEHNSFASATPALDETQLYVAWATPEEFNVLALDHDGKPVWRRNLGEFKAGHGFGASVIVHGDRVVVPNDQGGASSLVALHRDTGDVVWTIPRDSGVTYSTPCVYERPGDAAALIFSNWKNGITAVDPRTGMKKWEVDVFDKEHVECAIASPIVAGELVLATAGWMGYKNEVVALRPQAAGRKAEVLYRIERAAPLVTTPIVKDDLLFLWNDHGIATCADVQTGKVHWRERVGGSYYSSPICVRDRLYSMTMKGDVVVIAASKQYALLARNPLGEGSHSTPVVAGGRLYLRTFSHLISMGGGFGS